MPLITNKETGLSTVINFDFTRENCLNYRLKFNDYFLNPNDGKDYIWQNGKIVEKPINVEALRQNGLAYYKAKAELFREQKINDGSGGILVNKSDNSSIVVLTDLTMSSLNEWLIVKNKIGSPKKANVVNKETGLNEIIEITDNEVLRINTLLTALVDNITALDVRITNKIKTASDALILAVFGLTPEKLDMFTLAIMQNADQIIQMTDEQFEGYILQLLNS